MKNEHYFLGASSPDGFAPAIEDIMSDTDNNIFILKGTAGSGKSTLMKKISEAFPDSDKEIFHCSADPFSLDGVYIKDKKAFILDGTSPHCYDPVYPKSVENIVDLGAYVETAKLRAAKEEVISLTDSYSVYHKRCKYCLKAVSSIMSDITANAESILNADKLAKFTDKTLRRLIPKKSAGTPKGSIITRQLSAATMNGYSTYLPDSCEIYLLSDDYSAAAAHFLGALAEYAAAKGYDSLVSRCLLSKNGFFEHVIIPELKLAFVTSSFFNNIQLDENKKVIRFKRFYSPCSDMTGSIRKRLKFGQKAVNELIKEISSELINAKKVHDEIEEHYICAVDFDSLNRLSYKLISEIKSL